MNCLICAHVVASKSLMQEAEEARAQADARLDQVMAALGFEDWRGVSW